MGRGKTVATARLVARVPEDTHGVGAVEAERGGAARVFDVVDPLPATAERVPRSVSALGSIVQGCSTPCYGRAMSREISQRELRNQSGEIMRELDEGKSFVVTRNGVPVGELTPLRRHRFVAAETAVAMFRSAPGLDYRRFQADLDAAADPDAMPRA